jgi:iron complex transport system permease protein
MKRILIYLYLLALIATTLLALSVGAAHLDHLMSVLTHPTSMKFGSEHDILWQIRIPRIVTALCVGAALGAAGVMAQGACNNPLAEPAILGTSAGAAFGVLVGLLFNAVTIGSLGAIAFGVVGGLAASLFTFSMGRSRDGQSSVALIIVGIAASATISAVVGITTSMITRADARSVSFWTWGSLALTTGKDLWVLVPIAILGIVGAWWIAPQLDLLSLGDQSARHIGIDPIRARRYALIALSVLVAAAVSTVGTIAFLGLAAPHIARLGFGPRHRPLVLHSALIGAIILLLADTASRTVAAPRELPIGLITALIGAPLLIVLVRRNLEVWRQP